MISPVRSCQSNPLLLSTRSIAATAPTRSPLWFDDSSGNSLPSFSRTAGGRGRVGVAAVMVRACNGMSSSISSARGFLPGGRPCLAAPGFGCRGGAAAAAPPSVGGFLMRNALHGLPWYSASTCTSITRRPIASAGFLLLLSSISEFLFVTFKTSARLSSLKNTQGFEFPSCIFSGWMSAMVSVIGPSSRSSAFKKLLGNHSS